MHGREQPQIACIVNRLRCLSETGSSDGGVSHLLVDQRLSPEQHRPVHGVGQERPAERLIQALQRLGSLPNP